MPLDWPLPLDFAPMEAQPARTLPEGQDWRYEPKWDGFRCLAFRAGPAVELRAKSGKPLGRYFPEVLDSLGRLAARRFVVLDGELVVERAGRPSFEALQQRLHPAPSRIARLSRETPARLVVFDLPADPEGPLLDRTLAERRAALEAFVAAQGAESGLSLSPCTREVGQALAWLADSAREGGFDGVVAKRVTDLYQDGRRAIVKVKVQRSADCVVGGFRYAAKGGEVGSLLLGLYDEAGLLHHVGFTATLPAAERPALTRRLRQFVEPPGFTGRAPGGPSRWSTARSAQWEPLRPRLVVEVRYDKVEGQRFRHGTTLLRWRPDKAPEQCRLEQLAG